MTRLVDGFLNVKNLFTNNDKHVHKCHSGKTSFFVGFYQEPVLLFQKLFPGSLTVCENEVLTFLSPRKPGMCLLDDRLQEEENKAKREKVQGYIRLNKTK